MARERLAEMADRGLVTRTGLISHGRGEAFDYMMGERSLAQSVKAERAAAAFLLKAKNPVICVNGNAAALDPRNLIILAQEVPAKIEINIFHRTEERMKLLISHMEENGAENVLGADPDARIPGLSSDRALCTESGIYDSDVILVPIEDGDRAKALADMGKIVISIDLNPLSRTSRTAAVSISDEMTRALENMIIFVREMKGRGETIDELIKTFSNDENRRETINEICSSLRSESGGVFK
jgi:4-phosphopantoate--beta-alanine ligase